MTFHHNQGGMGGGRLPITINAAMPTFFFFGRFFFRLWQPSVPCTARYFRICCQCWCRCALLSHIMSHVCLFCRMSNALMSTTERFNARVRAFHALVQKICKTSRENMEKCCTFFLQKFKNSGAPRVFCEKRCGYFLLQKEFRSNTRYSQLFYTLCCSVGNRVYHREII